MAETIDHYTMDRSVDNQATWQRVSSDATSPFQDSSAAGNPANAVNQTVFYKPTGITTPSGLEVPYDIGRISTNAPGTLLNPVALFSLSTSGFGNILGVKMDPSGNSYVYGFWRGTLTLPDGTQWTSQGQAYFLVKLNSSRQVTAKLKFATGGNGAATPYGGMCIDTGNNVLLTGSIRFGGSFPDTCDFGNGVVEGPSISGNNQTFIYCAKFNSSLACQWANVYGSGASNCQGHRVTVDSTGRSYLGGITTGEVNFGGGARPYGPNFFFLSLTSAGDYGWDIYIPYSSAQVFAISGLAVDESASRLVVVGAFGGPGASVNFGDGVLTTTVVNVGFILKRSTVDGSKVWQVTYSSNIASGLEDVAIDPTTKDIVVIGAAKDGCDVGGGPVHPDVHQAGTGNAILIARYQTNGSWIWNRMHGGDDLSSFSYGSGVVIGGGGIIYTVGRYSTPWNFNGSYAGNSSALFIAAFSSANVLQWERRTLGSVINDSRPKAALVGGVLTVQSAGNNIEGTQGTGTTNGYVTAYAT